MSYYGLFPENKIIDFRFGNFGQNIFQVSDA